MTIIVCKSCGHVEEELDGKHTEEHDELCQDCKE